MNRICSGIGAIAFAVLTIATFVVGNPPGGDYSRSDVTDYLASGHQLAVFVSLYLGLLSAIGLLVLVAGLSSASTNDSLRRLFWGNGIAATAACATGWGLVAAPRRSAHLRQLGTANRPQAGLRADRSGLRLHLRCGLRPARHGAVDSRRRLSADAPGLGAVDDGGRRRRRRHVARVLPVVPCAGLGSRHRRVAPNSPSARRLASCRPCTSGWLRSQEVVGRPALGLPTT